MIVFVALVALVAVCGFGFGLALSAAGRPRESYLGRVLGEYRWFRRLSGGHWERWWVDVVHSYFWHAVDECSLTTGERPVSICRGTPTCEHWPRSGAPPAPGVLARAALCVLLLGCAPLPALITDAQVRAVLPEVHHADGMACAARLNSHVRAARASGVVRPMLLGVGALLGASGAAVRDLAPGAALPLAVSGALVGLAADLVLRLVADPVQLLAARSRGLASWDAARVDPDDGEHLVRCARDEAPRRSGMPLLGGSAP